MYTTLTTILPDVRLLAQHRGGADWVKVFDTLVAPWAAQALGEDLPVLAYDPHLSRLQALQLGELRDRRAPSSGIALAARGDHVSPARRFEKDPLKEMGHALSQPTENIDHMNDKMNNQKEKRKNWNFESDFDFEVSEMMTWSSS